jgi:hypothetical protein
VEDGREQEAVISVAVELRDGIRADAVYSGSERLHAVEQVSRAGLGGRGLVAVLGNEKKAGGEDR